MDVVIVQSAACGGLSVHFDSLPLAIEFLRMMTHQIMPEQWVAMVRALIPVPHTAEAVKAAQDLATKCLGTPS
jgi:hypothetical protein